MIKKIAAVIAAACTTAVLSAYNPPVSGESLDRLSSPTQLTSGSSAAGGGLFSAGPDSIVFNPALTAYEQRITLDAGYTGLFSSGEHPFGSAFQTGMLVPWKWCIGSAMVKGAFLPFEDMHAGYTLGTNVGVSKAVSEHVTVGAGVNAGLFWGAGTDWSLGASVGALYRLKALGFMKDFRVGVSVLNLGKNYSQTTLEGIDGNSCTTFPDIATVRAGAAAVLFSNEYVKGGVSFDLTTPCFQNLIVDMGFQMSVKDALYVNVAEQLDIREMAAGHVNALPAVSVGYRFTFNAANNTYMEKNGWQESEMTATGGWQHMYSSVNAFSAGLKMNLGMKDTEAPKIELWSGEEDKQ
jgi:hypothetical protein